LEDELGLFSSSLSSTDGFAREEGAVDDEG